VPEKVEHPVEPIKEPEPAAEWAGEEADS